MQLPIVPASRRDVLGSVAVGVAALCCGCATRTATRVESVGSDPPIDDSDSRIDAADSRTRDFLAAVEEAYGNLATYADEGRVVDYFGLPEHGGGVKVKPFRLKFARDGSPAQRHRVYFEYFEDVGPGYAPSEDVAPQQFPDRYVIWTGADGANVRRWWTVNRSWLTGRAPVEERDSLGGALGAATGVSGRASVYVPAMLMPDVLQGRRITRVLQDAAEVDQVVVADERWRVVEGSVSESERLALAVDERSMLIREIRRVVGTGRGTVYSKSVIRPQPNVEFSDRDFEFQPPGN